MREISWRGLLLGVVVIASLQGLCALLLRYVPAIVEILRPSEPGAIFSVNPILAALSVAFIHFTGGFIAGRLATLRPGLSGAIAASVSVIFWFSILYAPNALFVLGQSDDQLRNENMGLLFAQALILAPTAVLVIICGLLGGVFGGRFGLRNSP